MQSVFNYTGNGRGEQSMSTSNLGGFLSQIDDSIKASISMLASVVTDVKTEVSENTSMLSTMNRTIPDAINKLQSEISGTTGSDLLWSSATALTAGNSCTLVKNLNNYRFVAFQVGSVYPVSLVKSISATATYTNGSDTIDTYSLRGTYSSGTFTLNAFLVLSISTSGTSVNSTYTGITEIWGIK